MSEIHWLRALHVLGVVIWIGGVSMVTLVLLPTLRRGELGTDRLAAFHAIERRFVWIARVAVLVVGATGFLLVDQWDLWPRFALPEFWWMSMMVVVWTLFLLVLFVLEPLVLQKFFPAWAARDPDRAFAFLLAAHGFLLVLALVTILGSVAGAHGGSLFG